MSRASTLALTCFAVAAATACATGPQLREEHARLVERLDKARAQDAVTCAPLELAEADVHLALLEHELDEGEPGRADRHYRVAQRYVDEVVYKSDEKRCSRGPRDRDRDAVLDNVDRCPDEPEDRDNFEDEDGCPETDNDGDGLADQDDKCPNDPGPVENSGCPPDDKDRDGIGDSVDACVDEPEILDGVEDADGCPDNDRDGILDGADRCPVDPEDLDQFADDDGCPDPDNDDDTVLDPVDACPLEPGTPVNSGCPVRDRDGDGVNDDVDNCPDVPGSPPTGCPRRVLVVKTADKIEIKQQILFQTNKAKIRGNISFEILDQVTAVLNSNPEIRVIVEGHTDNRGRAQANLRLSTARAQAVRDALIERGIAENRVEAIGYGMTRPIESNRTAKGRGKNRRVEFVIVQNSAPESP